MATEAYRLSIQGNVNGQFNEVVQVFQSGGLATNDTLSAAVDLTTAWDTHLKALWLACLPTSYSLGIISARRVILKPSANFQKQYIFQSNQGSRSSDCQSYNLCPVVLLVPPMGTKSAGKTFLPAVSQGDVVNNTYLAAYQTAVVAYYNAAIAGAAGSGTNWQIGIYSRKTISVSLVQFAQLSPRLGFMSKRRFPIGA